jgi:hypothetical protein
MMKGNAKSKIFIRDLKFWFVILIFLFTWCALWLDFDHIIFKEGRLYAETNLGI